MSIHRILVTGANGELGWELSDKIINHLFNYKAIYDFN